MIEFGVLGPVVLLRDGERRTIPTVKLRRLMAMLLARAGSPVSMDAMIDALWPDAPPPSARRTVAVYVSRLRTLLGDDDRVEASGGSYWLHPGRDELDSLRFRSLIEDAARAQDRGDLTESADALGQGLGLWRGRAFEDLHDIAPVAAEAEALEQLRLASFEQWVDIRLALGQHNDVLIPLDEMIAAHSYRERLRAQRMLALYRAGRQAEALETYRQTYQLLVDDLGVEPAADLDQLHRRILAGDRDLLVPTTGPRAGVPNLLPRSVSFFTGRSAEVSALDEIAAGDGLTSPVAVISALTGTAGVGKTALAVHWARTAVDRFPDAQLYINLQGHGAGEPLSPLAALVHLLKALGADADRMPDDEQSAVALYRSMLADSRALVLLDNAASAAQVRPLLAAGPRCMSVVTSRNRLAGLVVMDGARRIPVDIMLPADAVRLLASVLGTDRIDAEPIAALALAELCGRLPLALRIAAAALADEPTTSIAVRVAAYATTDRLPLLAVEGDPESSVRAALGYSYFRLGGEGRRTFRLLGTMLSLDTGAVAAAATVDRDVETTTAVLDQLCAGHLLEEHAPGRYRFHDLIREYARELAQSEDTADERDAALDRMLTWYAAHASNADTHIRIGTQPREWVDLGIPVPEFAGESEAFDWFEVEGPNIVAVIGASEAIRPTACWQLATSAFPWFQQRTGPQAWAAAYEIGLRAATSTDNVYGEAFMRTGLAIALAYANRREDALPHFEWTLRARRDEGNSRRLVVALANLGGILSDLLRPAEAIRYLEESLGIIEGDPGFVDKLAPTLQNIAYAYATSGQEEKSLGLFRRAIGSAQATGDRLQAALSSHSLATALLDLDRCDEAKPLFEHALAYAIEVGHQMLQCWAYTSLGLTAVRQEDGEAAEAYLVSAEKAYEAYGYSDTGGLEILRTAVAAAQVS